MNYFHLIKAFRILKKTSRLTAPAIALWYGLAAIANETGLYNGLALPISTLMEETGLNKKSIERARLLLAQKGFIKWEQRSGNQSAVYNMLDLVRQNELEFVPQSVPQPVPQSVPQPVPQSVPIYKLNKTKLNQEESLSFANGLNDDSIDAVEISQQLDAVEREAKGIGIPCAATHLDIATGLIAEYGFDALIATIRQAAYRQKPSWRIIELILGDSKNPPVQEGYTFGKVDMGYD